MGILRIGGGISGVEDYLEKGKKQHNEFSRDELDQRVVLSGDLDITREVIASMENAGLRYLHLTFSVKELDLPVETFRQIDAEIKNFLLSAYPDGSLDYYSELQRPKIKTQLNKATGELVDRLDHIHIVIPRVNLVTGKIEDPTGFGDRNQLFFDALQEHINIKFGLASPKDNIRVDVSTADIVARVKDDDSFKKGNDKSLKALIAEGIISEEITSYDDFQKYLKKLGDVKVSNKGKDNEYLGIKIAGQKRFVNLREEPFRKAFFELPEAEMRQRLGVVAESKKSRMIPKKSAEEYDKLIAEWHSYKAREVRYVNSGNTKAYKEYKAASLAEKLEKLDELEKKAKERFEKKEKRREKSERKQQTRDRNAGPSRDAGSRNDRDNGARAVHQPLDLEIGQRPPPAARGRLRDLSELPLVPTTRGTEVLLPRDVSGDLEQPRSEVVHTGVRRTDTHVNPATGRTADSAVSQLLRDVQEAGRLRDAEQRPDMKTIKLNLDARRLLADLAASHGLKKDEYIISEGADGGGRIRHKDEKVNHNVSDFLTKHVHLSWGEAQPYLQASYDRQLSNEPERKSKPARDKLLWKEFRIERQAAYENRFALRAQAKAEHQASVMLRRREIKDEYLKSKAKIFNNPQLDRAAKKAAQSILAMQKAESERLLNEKVAIERVELARKKTLDEAYNEFLLVRAQAGNRLALLELRRQQDDRDEAEEKLRRERLVNGMLSGDKHKTDDAEIVKHPALQHSINRFGDVTYSKNGRDILQDRGTQVDILDQSKETIEQGLRLSAQKWGGKMRLFGSEKFIQDAIRISVEKNLGITFTDPAQAKYQQEYAEQYRQNKALQQKGRDFTNAAAANAEKEARAAARKAAAEREEQARAAAERQAQAEANALRQAQAKAAKRTAATLPEALDAAQDATRWKRVPSTVEQRSLVQRSVAEIESLQAERKSEAEKKSKTSLPQPGRRSKKRDDDERDR